MSIRALRHNETGLYVGGYYGDKEGLAKKLIGLGHDKKEAYSMADKLGMMSVYEFSKKEDDYEGAMRIAGSGCKELFPRESVTILKDDEIPWSGGINNDEMEDEDDGLLD